MTSSGRKLVVASGSLVAVLGLCELGLRVAGYDPFGDALRAGRQEPGELLAGGFLREREHEVLVYDLMPDARAFAWGADVETNAHGFRDRPRALAKPPGTRRVVALGDSATFGVKLPADVLWPARLEAALADHQPPVEVLNLGIVGYDVLEELALLEERGLAFAPDVVALAFHPNDLGYASPTRDYVRRLRSYGAPLYRLRLAQFVRSRVDRAELAREQARRASEEVFVEQNAPFLADLSGDAELRARVAALGDRLAGLGPSHRYLKWFGSLPRVARLRFALERLAALQREHDLGVVVFVVPRLGDAGHEGLYDEAYALLAAEVERAGLAWLDVVPATRALGHETLRIEENDHGHPDAAGHAAFAAALARFLDERGWLR